MAAPALSRSVLTVAEPVLPGPLRPTALRPALLLAWVGLVVSVVAILATVLSDLPGPVRLIGILLFALAGPGCAIVAQSRLRERATAGAIAVVLSMAVFATVPTLLAWVDRWAPAPSVVLLAAASAVSCAVAIVHSGQRPRLVRLTPSRRRAWTRRTLADAGVIAAALAVWLIALRQTSVANVGDFGLLSVLWPGFWVAPLLLIGGAVTELVRGARRGGILSVYVAALIVVIHGTTPALLAFPEYAWTYKHIGVIEFFASGQHINSATDIYQQWPAFFTAAAQLTGASGVPALNYAAWAPVVFNLTVSLVLYAIARTLQPDRRAAFASVLIFQCVNWIEEDYLSPQGFAFVLSLGVFLILLRFLRAAQPLPARLRYLQRDAPPPTTGARRGWAIAAVLFLTAVITAAHQLSPYEVAGGVIVLVLLGLVRPWWIAIAVSAIPVAYLMPRFRTVSGNFGIFDSFNILGNASGTAQAWGTVGQAVSALAVRTLTLVVWVLVAVVVVRQRRHLGRVLAPLVLAVVPFGLLFAQNYGGEAIYRVYLFSAPWVAILLAGLMVAWAPRWRRRVWAGIGVGALALTVALAGTLQGRHGQLTVDQQHAADIQAAQYLYAHGEPGATIVLATPDFPSRISAAYWKFNQSVPVGEPDLVTGAKLTGILDGDALPAIETFAESFDGTTAYLVISDQMRRQAHYFGYLPDGSLDALPAALDQDPHWTLVYRNAGVLIYQLHG